MDLSVVIVNWKAKEYLHRCLHSLAEAKDECTSEVLVVDNHSLDGTPEMVARDFPRVQVFDSGRNGGFAFGCNAGIRRASGRHVLLLNPDTRLPSGTMEAMVRFLDQHPEAGAAGCRVLNDDGSFQAPCRRAFPTPRDSFFKLFGLSALFPQTRLFSRYEMTYRDAEQVEEVDAISGSFMLLRRSALEAVGLLDERFFLYGEDLDLCYRLQEAGWKVYYNPAVEITHSRGKSRWQNPITSLIAAHRAMILFYDKHYRQHCSWLLTAAVKSGILLRAAGLLPVAAARAWLSRPSP